MKDKFKKWCKAFCWVLIVIGLLMNVFGFFITAKAAPSPAELDFDYNGVIVGVLSLLVTALLGWNVYTLIDIKNIQELYKTSLLDITNEKDERERQIHQLRSMIFNVTGGILGNIEKDHTRSLEHYVQELLSSILADEDDELINSILDRMAKQREKINLQENNELGSEKEFKESVGRIIKSGRLNREQVERFIEMTRDIDKEDNSKENQNHE